MGGYVRIVGREVHIILIKLNKKMPKIFIKNGEGRVLRTGEAMYYITNKTMGIYFQVYYVEGRTCFRNIGLFPVELKVEHGVGERCIEEAIVESNLAVAYTISSDHYIITLTKLEF